MKYCEKCGTELNDNANFCSKCGASQQSTNSRSFEDAVENMKGTAGDFAKKVVKLNDTPDTSFSYDTQDIADYRVMAALAYLGALALVPLFAAKNSPYARYHVNQGIILLIVRLAAAFVCSLLGISLLQGLVALASVIYIAIGITNALSGRAKELPLIGKYRILK